MNRSEGSQAGHGTIGSVVSLLLAMNLLVQLFDFFPSIRRHTEGISATAPLPVSPKDSLAPLASTKGSYLDKSDTNFTNERPDTLEALGSFGNVWPEVKNTICPARVPNKRISNTLFALARDEMGLRQWNNPTQTSIHNFYARSDNSGFVYSSHSNNKTLVYMSIWKAGHNTILTWAEQYVQPLEGNFSFFHGNAQMKKILKNATADNTCIVTMIRDPVSHFLSGYNEIETRIKDAEYSNPRMNSAPKALFHRFHYGTKQRFIQFVSDVLSVPSTLGWIDYPKIEPLHIYAMSGTLWHLSQYDVQMSDYLPTMKDFQTQWPIFVYNSCPEILPRNITAPFNIPNEHESSKDPYGTYKAAKDVWKEEGPIARAICVLNVMDYACWDHLPDGIPPLCQTVYSSKNFVTKLQKHRHGNEV